MKLTRTLNYRWSTPPVITDRATQGLCRFFVAVMTQSHKKTDSVLCSEYNEVWKHVKKTKKAYIQVHVRLIRYKTYLDISEAGTT